MQQSISRTLRRRARPQTTAPRVQFIAPILTMLMGQRSCVAFPNIILPAWYERPIALVMGFILLLIRRCVSSGMTLLFAVAVRSDPVHLGRLC